MHSIWCQVVKTHKLTNHRPGITTETGASLAAPLRQASLSSWIPQRECRRLLKEEAFQEAANVRTTAATADAAAKTVGAGVTVHAHALFHPCTSVVPYAHNIPIAKLPTCWFIYELFLYFSRILHYSVNDSKFNAH
jgi:hypothetical protein